jgi:hypothetical protein
MRALTGLWVGCALALGSAPLAAQSLKLSCQQRAEMTQHTASVWHEMHHPATLTANLLGYIKGRAEHRLLLAAFVQLDAGAPTAQVVRAVKAACEAIPPRQFDEEQTFYLEGGNTPPELTACSGVMSNLLIGLPMPEAELAAAIAAQSGPLTRAWVRKVLSESPPNPTAATAKAAAGRAFDQCEGGPPAARAALARELYAQ